MGDIVLDILKGIRINNILTPPKQTYTQPRSFSKMRQPSNPFRGWVMLKFDRSNVLKGIVPNYPGIYAFFDEYRRLLYVGHSKVLRHRIQSYYQDDCFKEHPTKINLRGLIKLFAYKVMPTASAMTMEKNIKPRAMYNYL